MKELSRGAEAVVTSDGKRVEKHRLRKSYRHARLDERLRKQRTRKEAKVLAKAREIGLCVPALYSQGEEKLEIEHVHGKMLKAVAGEDSKKAVEKTSKLLHEVGTGLALLHKHSIMHGDLTTTNLIASPQGVCFIDFGLAFHSTRLEDKAVDLHLLKKSLESGFPHHAREFFAAVKDGYAQGSGESARVFKQLENVEKRGRYKEKT